MKTSFYFFLWIIIYPLLALLHNPWIYQNSFIVAVIAVFGLSWLLNRIMPDTLRYERASEMAIVLEEIYTCNIKGFMQRLWRQVSVEFITAVYFGVTFVFILFSMVRGSADDWIALLIFGFFGFGAISRAFRLNTAYKELKSNPTRDECASVMERVYGFDYSSYYSSRQYTTAETMLPPMPKHFKAFQIFSIIIAIICGLFGLGYLIFSIVILSENHSADAISGGIMYFLYGSLAAYFGIKDTVTCLSTFRRRKKNPND